MPGVVFDCTATQCSESRVTTLRSERQSALCLAAAARRKRTECSDHSDSCACVEAVDRRTLLWVAVGLTTAATSSELTGEVAAVANGDNCRCYTRALGSASVSVCITSTCALTLSSFTLLDGPVTLPCRSRRLSLWSAAVGVVADCCLLSMTREEECLSALLLARHRQRNTGRDKLR